MGRGTNGAVLAPAHDGAGRTADSDQQLVARVRRGDDRAFEILYERYHRRIHAYVLGMVKDHGRSEDVTQEVFVSALRRMRETEQPLAFKPWLYQIAKNSCIDAFRRSRRAEEVSYDADDALAPSDQSRLVGSGPSPDAAVAAKEDLDNLCGAFGGLSETHHEILVLRELEGLSYQEIGRRMGMSRPAVESTLFRARRRLTEEYDDIVSGARCQRIQGIIVTASQSRLGARDTRRLARHLSHCQSCRREALAAGLDRGLFGRPSVRERIASKVAGLLPFPAFLKFRRGADVPPPTGRGAAFWSQLPQFAEQGWGKAAAGAAVLVAGVGAGVGVHHHQTATPTPAAVHAAPVAATKASAPTKPVASPDAAATAEKPVAVKPKHRTRSKAASAPLHRAKADRDTSSVPRTTSGGGGQAAESPARTGGGDDGGGSASGSGAGGGSGGSSSSPKLPAVPLPTGKSTTEQTQDAVKQTTDVVTQTTEKVTGAVNETTQTATEQVDNTVTTVTGSGPVAESVDKATDDVDQTVGAVTGGVDKTVKDTTGAVNGILGGGG